MKKDLKTQGKSQSLKNTPISNIPSKDSLKKNKEKPGFVPGNKPGFINRDAIIFSVISIAVFIFIRLMFPTPDYIQDSKGYILGAINDADIGYRPMGISVFLAKMHNLNPSIVFVAWAQYILNLTAGLALAYAFRLVFDFGFVSRKLLYAVCLVNPTLLYLANTITSDSLFCSFTIWWIAMVIFLIRNPKWYFVTFILVILWLNMFIRYNALIYPIITIAAVLLTRKWYFIFAGTAVCILITWGFYNTIEERMELATDIRVFSGFSGWQLGSNAMKAYKTVANKGIATDDPVLQLIDKQCITYIDSINHSKTDYKNSFETDFIWSESSPFKKYQLVMQRNDHHLNQFSSWTAVSLIIGKYAKAVMLAYPGAFFKSYLMPNTVNFFYPDPEALSKYSAPEVDLFPQIREWYGLPDKAKTTRKDLPNVLNKPMQIIYAILSILFLPAVLVFMAKRKKWNISYPLFATVLFLVIFWICKAGFEIFAAPLTLRYVIMALPMTAGVIIIVTELILRNREAGKIIENSVS